MLSLPVAQTQHVRRSSKISTAAASLATAHLHLPALAAGAASQLTQQHVMWQVGVDQTRLAMLQTLALCAAACLASLLQSMGLFSSWAASMQQTRSHQLHRKQSPAATNSVRRKAAAPWMTDRLGHAAAMFQPAGRFSLQNRSSAGGRSCCLMARSFWPQLPRAAMQEFLWASAVVQRAFLAGKERATV